MSPLSDPSPLLAFAPDHGFSTRPVRAPTPAEHRVLTLLLAGYSNKEIGAQIGRAESTVKNQVASLLRKFRVPTRTRLIALLK